MNDPLEFSSEYKFAFRWLLLLIAIGGSATIGRFLLRVMDSLTRLIESAALS